MNHLDRAARKVRQAFSIRHYFVDEAGDGTLFDEQGHVIVGAEGCSRYLWALQRLYERREGNRSAHVEAQAS